MGCESSPVSHAVPNADSLFDPVEGSRGLRLALVFGNEAPQGKCPFFGNQCSHCDLGEGEGIRFTPEINRARLDFFRSHYSEALGKVNHLVVYNSGSTLHSLELSDETLGNILEFAGGIPSLRRVSFDSREDFVTTQKLDRIFSALRPDQTATITLGLESQDDTVRMKTLGKRITREEMESVFRQVAGRAPRGGIDLNILFQPPGLLGNEAVDEALATVGYGLEMGARFKVPVDFNFHPYYPSWRGTLEHPNHPRAIVQDAIRCLILAIRLIREHSPDSRLFVGLNDEGHDQQSARRQRDLYLYIPGLKSFNVTQDEKDLRI